jgi:hypothetical protein
MLSVEPATQAQHKLFPTDNSFDLVIGDNVASRLRAIGKVAPGFDIRWHVTWASVSSALKSERWFEPLALVPEHVLIKQRARLQ